MDDATATMSVPRRPPWHLADTGPRGRVGRRPASGWPRPPRRALWAACAGVCAAVLLAGCAAAVDPAVMEDAQTAARVKTALVNDPEVGDLPIEVRVAGGTAVVSGLVRSRAEADRVIGLTRGVAGVAAVESNLRIGAVAPDVPAAPPSVAPQSLDFLETEGRPGLLALGAAVGWSIPGPVALKTRMSISPLIKIGSPRGLAPAIGFDWFHADVESAGRTATLARVHVKPVMAGLGYTVAADRVSLTPSIVGGVSFNSLTITDTGAAQGLPVEVGNSFAWRVGASLWYDATRRVAVNASTGYLLTGLRLTVLEGARLERRDVRGDTAILHVGIAYRLF